MQTSDHYIQSVLNGDSMDYMLENMCKMIWYICTNLCNFLKKRVEVSKNIYWVQGIKFFPPQMMFTFLTLINICVV
jgi:hypothetical protein